MAGSGIPKLLQDAGQVKEALEKIGTALPGGVSAKVAVEQIADLNGAVSKLDNLNAERTKLVNEKRASAKNLRAFITKARLAIKVECGDDSSEYEMAGGTRRSERKKAVRKPKPPKQA
jgi:hypothetical protein